MLPLVAASTPDARLHAASGRLHQMKEAAATDQNFSGASAGVVGRSPHTVVRYDAECDTEGQGPESHSTIYIYTIVPAEGARARVP